MDLKNYDYTEIPYSFSKFYDIHSLTNEGFNQYISNDSYAHKYLKNRIDINLLEKIYNEEISNKSLLKNLKSNNLCNENENYFLKNEKVNKNETNQESESNKPQKIKNEIDNYESNKYSQDFKINMNFDNNKDHDMDFYIRNIGFYY